MGWSWRLGKVAGIDVRVHATFVLLIGFVALSYWLQAGSLEFALQGVVFLLALFACVLLHEFGHALAARRYGIPTRDITLLPIGGVARLERMPSDPRQELVVALAGPAVNVVIAAILFVWLALTEGFAPLAEIGVTGGPLLERLLLTNLLLVGFNLVPAFPMDGGRVLRALLATRLDYVHATQIAASLGQGIAFLFGLWGLFTNPLLVFTALFVWIGAQQEAAHVQARHALSGVPVRAAMLTNFLTLAPDDRLARAAEYVLAGSQRDFPVVSYGRVIGALSARQLFAGLAQQGPHALVGEIMHPHLPAVTDEETLENASEHLQGEEMRAVAVTRDGQLVGLLTLENVAEFMQIRNALRSAPGRAS